MLVAMSARAALVLAAGALLLVAPACGDDDVGSGDGDAGTPRDGSTSPPPTPPTPTPPTPTPPTPPIDGGPAGPALGPDHEGEYHLGPVEWEGSFWNACAPYPPEIQAIEGGLLAGLSNEVAADGSQCDACIAVTTARGRSAVLRVVTYGVTTAPGNIDVSQAAFDVLTEGEHPRTMSWHLVPCPTTEPLYLQYQTGANPWWTSLWVRNPRVAIDRVEVRSANHAELTPLRRSPDGTYTDDGGFGEGPFTLHVVGIDGSTFEQSFDAFEPGALVAASGNL